MTIVQRDVQRAGRAGRLKAATGAVHERLDTRVMAARPFDDRDRYGRFLRMQHAFLRDVDALYRHPELAALLPDLADRRRLDAIEHDLADLDQDLGPNGATPPVDTRTDAPAAMGWLYVSEGSTLGAAILLKHARALGLSETFGARHMAAPAAGRGQAWRTFTATLDALDFDEADDRRMIEGATAAFDHVLALAEELLP